MKSFTFLLATLVLTSGLSAQFDANREINFQSLTEALREPLRVYHLNLADQNLQTVPREILEMPNLISLDLSGNAIKSLEGVDFSSLKKLQYLEMADNQLREIPEDFIQNLPVQELILLNLNSNSLRAIPESINRLTFLEELLLANNKLQNLPALRFKFLKRLRIDRNGLDQFPQTLLRLVKLESLNLNGNNIAAIPPEIQQLKRLRLLNIGDNQLQDIPDLSLLRRLRTLIIDWNNYTDPNATFAQVVQIRGLEILSAENCGIEQIPTSIKRMRQLRELSLINNKILHIPQALNQLKRLEKLWLNGNLISKAAIPVFKRTVEVIY